MNSVARASIAGGTLSCNAAAVRRLIIRSKRAFCCTGSCAGGVPRRMRSAWSAWSAVSRAVSRRSGA